MWMRSAILQELKLRARGLCKRHGWPTIDVSRRSIEETAARDSRAAWQEILVLDQPESLR